MTTEPPTPAPEVLFTPFNKEKHKPGYYWLTNEPRTFLGIGRLMVNNRLNVDGGMASFKSYLFGPRIPSPKQIVEMNTPQTAKKAQTS